MLERLTPHRRNLALGALGLLVLWFAWTVRAVLNPLILGYLLAFIAQPLVTNLERAGWKRRSAVNAIFVGAGLLTVVLGLALFLQGRNLALRLAESDVFLVAEQRLGTAAQSAVEWMDSFREEEGGSEPTEETARTSEPSGAASEETATTEKVGESDETAEADAQADEQRGWSGVVSDFWATLSEEQTTRNAAGRVAIEGTSRIWQILSAWFGSLLAFGTLVVLLPVYTYFMLFELERTHGFIRRYLPIRDRERLSAVAAQLGEVLSNFFRGRLLVCFFKGIFLAIGLALLGVDYALLIGLGSGFLALVPFVGPFIGFIGAFLIGLLDSEPLGLFIRISLIFGLAELLEGYVLLPKILGDSLGLHPVVVLVSIMIGGAALGIFGFLLALPLTAAIVILFREFVMPALEDFADEGGDSDEPPAEATAST